MTNHSWKTIIGLSIIGAIGALQALHGQEGMGWTDIIISLLLAIEHGLNGKTE